MQKKALIIGPLPPPYHGVAVMIEWLIEGLRKRNGLDFIHLNTQDPKKSKDFGKFTPRNSWFALKNIFRLIIYLTRGNIETVYIPISQKFWGFLRDSIFILISGMLFRRRVVIHVHGGYFKTFFDHSSSLGKKYIRWVFQYVDRGIVLGHCLKYLLKDVLPEDRIDVVPNGIEALPFEESPGERKDNGKFHILFAGVLEESKGFFDLIKAVPTLARFHPDIEVYIAGRWQGKRFKELIESYVRNHDLGKYVKFVGVVTGEEKIDLFQSSDVFVLPTYYHLEGQPVVILEAMAAGLPVITCDRGSIKEMISHQENGFIIPPSSPDQIAEKLARLIEDRNLSAKMGERNRKKVKERFTLHHYVEGVVETLEKSGW